MVLTLGADIPHEHLGVDEVLGAAEADEMNVYGFHYSGFSEDAEAGDVSTMRKPGTVRMGTGNTDKEYCSLFRIPYRYSLLLTLP